MSDDFDYLKLDRMLDKVKSKVFMSKKGAAFFGPLMSSMEFHWSTGIKTACTDGVRIWWNPEFFLNGPTEYQEPNFNEFVLRHELWHPARLHMLRQGDRDGDLWNYACDVRINNDLKAEGYSWGTFPAWYMPHMDVNGPMVEEDIFDQLFKQGFVPPPNPWGNEELIPPDSKQRSINNVVRAKTEAEMADKIDDIPGGTKTLLDHFLAPVIPWEQVLLRWMTDLSRNSFSWRRPRRRTMPQNIYLPSHQIDDDRLAHLMYLQDTSGSITEQAILRFNSELKYVWDKFKPKKMTVVQFDSIIQRVDEYKTGDAFIRVEITGRGGNDMEPVRQFIDEHRPTAAIIFTDLFYEPMRPLEYPIPVLWVVDNDTKEPPYGEKLRIHISQGRPFQ